MWPRWFARLAQMKQHTHRSNHLKRRARLISNKVRVRPSSVSPGLRGNATDSPRVFFAGRLWEYFQQPPVEIMRKWLPVFSQNNDYPAVQALGVGLLTQTLEPLEPKWRSGGRRLHHKICRWQSSDCQHFTWWRESRIDCWDNSTSTAISSAVCPSKHHVCHCKFVLRVLFLFSNHHFSWAAAKFRLEPLLCCRTPVFLWEWDFTDGMMR